MSQTADTSCPQFPPVVPPIATRLILLDGVLLSIYALLRRHRLDTSSAQGARFWLQRRRTFLHSKQQQQQQCSGQHGNMETRVSGVAVTGYLWSSQQAHYCPPFLPPDHTSSP